MNLDVSYLINKYLDYLEVERGASKLTLRNYKHYLNRFLEFINKNTKIKNANEINQDTVHDYRLFLSRYENSAHSPLSRKTQGFHAIALRSFLKWCLKMDLDVMAPDKIDLPKTDERHIEFLNGEEVDKLLNAPSLSTIDGVRDKAILEVLFSTGLRVSELVQLNRDDINFETREFGVLGKGKKMRVVFLSIRACEYLKRYLNARDDKYKPLFVRHRGKTNQFFEDEKARITPRSVQRMVKKYARKLKLPFEATPHSIRHSYATDLLIAGADIRSVQEMLGHKNIQTTQIYTHVTHKHLKEIHERYHSK